MLGLAVFPEDDITEGSDLCHLKGPVGLPPGARSLIRSAYRLGPLRPPGATSRSYFHDVQGECVAAMEQGSPFAFEARIRHFAQLVDDLFECSTLPETRSAELRNAVELTDASHLFGKPFYVTWMRIFLQIVERAAAKADLDDDFLLTAISFQTRFFRAAQKHASVRATSFMVQLPRLTFGRILGWWTRTVERQGSIVHNPTVAVRLTPPQSATFQRVMVAVVGQWDHLRDNLLPRYGDAGYEWSEYGEVGSLSAEHLEESALMVLQGVHLGNHEAVEWMLDSLVKWRSGAELRLRDSGIPILKRQELLTIELLGKAWGDASQEVDAAYEGDNVARLQRRVFVLSVTNYWSDVCLAAAAVAAVWARGQPNKPSVAALVVRHVARGGSLRDGGDDGYPNALKPLASADQTIASIVRQFHANGSYIQGYRARLDRVVESAEGLREAEMVPGRIYSRWGANDLASVSDGMLLVLALLVPRDWDPRSALEPSLRHWNGSEDDKLRDLQERLGQWITRAESDAMDDLAGLFLACDGNTNQLEFKAALSSVSGGLQRVIAAIAEMRDEALERMDPSDARRSELAKWCTAGNFEQQTGPFPLGLFRSVEPTGELLGERALVLRGQDKGLYTEPALAQRPVNEEEWFAEALSQHVSASVLGASVSLLKPTDVATPTADEYWRVVKAFAAEVEALGQRPILLIESTGRPNWLWEWIDQWPMPRWPRPSDMQISRDVALTSPEYQGNLNSVAVYRAPLSPGTSLLLTRESLRRVRFTRFSDGQYVEVSFAPIEGDPRRLDVRLSWRLSVDVVGAPCRRLTYSVGDDRRSVGEG